MADIKVPVLPESVADATVAAWHKKPGEPVRRDENLVDIETDKVILEVLTSSPATVVQDIKDLMLKQPSYCDGLPLATDGKRAKRYGK